MPSIRPGLPSTSLLAVSVLALAASPAVHLGPTTPAAPETTWAPDGWLAQVELVAATSTDISPVGSLVAAGPSLLAVPAPPVRPVTVTWHDDPDVEGGAEADDPDDETGDEAGDEAGDAAVAYVAADGERIDADRLRPWLEGRDSPLAEHAEDLVAAGVEHDVDPRLVVGIAAIESSVGTRLPPGSHNAWGWSGGGAHGLEAWSDWPEAIDDFTARLGRLYDTEQVDEDFARTYCPPNWRAWLDTVTWVIDDL